jgi:hypothetical protein
VGLNAIQGKSTVVSGSWWERKNVLFEGNVAVEPL